ncbi:MAG: TRAM domain-containing protein, partial [Gemmatimonadetes bacterium]|nr:TRAM domain-containing protein [Gemmatimonadota bacterium]
VPEAVKGERLQHIIALQEGISRQINQQQVGRTVEVLVEGPSKRPAADGQPRYYGRTPQGKTAIFPQPAASNELVSVHVARTTSHTLFGDRIDDAV